MGLNIKNERVHELAREAARRSGRTQTSVIELALERFLAELDAPEDKAARRARIDLILADVDARLTDEDRAAMTADFLYDEDGLPA